MDPLFLGGLVAVFAAIGISTIMDGNSFGPLMGPSSFVLVFFGAVGAGLMAYRTAELSKIPKATIYSMKGRPPDPSDAVTTLAELAQIARRDGMLALESKLETIDDAYLRAGLQYLVDGLDAERVRELLEIDIAALDERHQTAIDFFKALAGYAPTFGMVGTVIGLINMLGNLSDPDQLGAGMALALLTTLYGVLLANVLFSPIATRLDRLNQLELSAREVVLDGILSIQAGMSPRLVVERLETYLPPDARLGHAERVGKATEATAA
jgi:chemotaxis protein MotA